jgi:hypothetical protein
MNIYPALGRGLHKLQTMKNFLNILLQGGTPVAYACNYRLMPVILATWEVEIWKIVVQGHPRQIVQETTSPK